MAGDSNNHQLVAGTIHEINRHEVELTVVSRQTQMGHRAAGFVLDVYPEDSGAGV